MSSFKQSIATVVSCAVIATLVLVPRPAAAQNGFFFKPPGVTFEMRFGRTVRDASSDVFNYMTQSLTLDKKDFNAAAYAGAMAIRTSERSDFVVGVGYAKSNASSESRDYVGTDDKPI